MTIGEMSKEVGLSPDTLRYYEKIGLVRHVERSGGRRSYERHHVLWLRFIKRLKQTGMSLAMIRRYSDLRHEGDETITRRKEMLLSHKQDLERTIGGLMADLAALEDKIRIYEQMEEDHAALRKRNGKA